MRKFVDFPFIFSIFSLIVLSLSVHIGSSIRRRNSLDADESMDFRTILSAILTLLFLILGFTFSMAITRYDQRMDYEGEEANAISIEYSRADMLSAADAVRVHALLGKYLEQRILFYQTNNRNRLRQIDATTSALQNDLESAVRTPSEERPAAVLGLIVSGMDDVLGSQGRTQSAWRNRIPRSAWVLMSIIAILSSFLLGFGAYHLKARPVMFLILPIVISMSFLLIADIDSPRGGFTHINPENLVSLSQSLLTH